MGKYVPFNQDRDVQDNVYTFVGGQEPHTISFTNSEATHAVNDFHGIIEPGREYDVPYNLGIMGGCLAHACKWSDEVVNDLEAGDHRQFFSVLARMVSAYYQGRAMGIFDTEEARNS